MQEAYSYAAEGKTTKIGSKPIPASRDTKFQVHSDYTIQCTMTMVLLCPAGVPSCALSRLLWRGEGVRSYPVEARKGVCTPGLGHGLQKSCTQVGRMKRMPVALHILQGHSLSDELLVLTGTTSEGKRKSPLRTAPPCSLPET